MLTLMLASKSDVSIIYKLEFEHSLVSLSKWEEIFQKPFFGLDDKTEEELREYFYLMLLNDPPEEEMFSLLSLEDVNEIVNYMNSIPSGTTFRDVQERPGGSKVISSEQIYSWLTTFRIPFEPTNTWHISRLMNLVKIMSIANTKQQPVSHAKRMEDQRALNAQRRAATGSTG